MDSFGSIALKKKEEHEKMKGKKKFGTPNPSPVSKTLTNRAIGGASPVSVDAINRLNAIEDDITLNEDVTDRLDALESTTSSNSGNISSLDTAASNALTKAIANETELQAVRTSLMNKADTGHDHEGVYLSMAQVKTLILQCIADTSTVPDDPSTPTILAGQYGSDFDYTATWSDEFEDTEADTLFNRWHPDVMEDALHQVGNNGVDGWRWSANYTQPMETAFVKDGALHMRAVVDDIANPLRKAFSYQGNTLNPQDKTIRLAFLTTWARKYDTTLDRQVTDPDAPNRTWGPGTAFDFKVDLTNMRTQGCRISFYLLPAYENDGNSYTPDGTIGVETDVTEVDFLDGFENYSQSKVISDTAAGNTPAGSIDLASIISGLDLPEGEHTFTLLWAKDRFVWYVNGIEIQRDTDPRRIPQVPHYVVISREANSGVKAQRTDGILDDGQFSYSDGTNELPEDTGLWAVPVWEEIDRLDNDSAKILSFKSFSFVDNSVAGIGIGDDTSGISPTLVNPVPPASFPEGTAIPISFLSNGRAVSQWFVEVGYTRGGNELGSGAPVYPSQTVTISSPTTFTGPTSVRLWFREDTNSVWHWRDFVYNGSMQPYKTGTDGLISVTAPQGTFVGSVPTVGGLGHDGVSTGTDGSYASSLDYSSGVVPSDYVEGYTPASIGVVGGVAPVYSGTATLSDVPSLRYDQYPNLTGELLWNAPTSFNTSTDKYEVTINGIIVYRSTGNSFFVEDYPASGANVATVRVVRDDGSFGPLLTLNFTTYVV